MMNNNILLINTSFRDNKNTEYANFGPPMGLIVIAASLNKHGYNVTLIDPQVDPDYLSLIRKALSEKPLFVGMSTYLGENIKHAVKLSQLIKEEHPTVPLVLGGPLASSVPNVFFEEMPVDFIVMGPGEDTITKLADALKKSIDPVGIPHISYTNNSQLVTGEMPIFRGNLDDLPQPDFEFWQKGVSKLESIPIITSRGCKRGCAFCYNTFTGRGAYYLRSPESVINEMEHWATRFNVTKFRFFDDNFLLDPNRALTIIKEMEKRKWKTQRLFGHLNEFDNINIDQIASTVEQIIICIESASPRIQKILNKRLDLKKAIRVIQRIRDHNIQFTTAFMFGLPTETDADIRLSIEYADHLRKEDSKIISMCYIYAPQPKDAIVKNYLTSDQHTYFSLDTMSEVEVVPVPPDNRLDLRLRPWMTADDQTFYLDFVQVWQYHFANYRNPNFDLSRIYQKNQRIKDLFHKIKPPQIKPSSVLKNKLINIKSKALNILNHVK